jgi:hypothetical protein
MQKRIANGFSLARNSGPIWRYSKESTGCAKLFVRTAQQGLMDVEVMRSATR